MRQYLRPSLIVIGLLLALLIPSILIAEAARPGTPAPAGSEPSGRADTGTESDAARARLNYGRLPLSFEPNRGQADARAQFLARNGAYSLYLAADEVAVRLRGAPDGGERASVLRIRLLGASREARARGLEELEGRSNYLVGRDPSRWRTNIPNYGRVRYEGVYPCV